MILYYTSLLYLPASIFEMLRGGILIFVAIFSIILLKKKLNKFEVIGLILVTIGMTLVGLAYNLNVNYDSKYFWFGFITLLVSMFFDGIYFISIEKLYKVYYINSIFIIAW